MVLSEVIFDYRPTGVYDLHWLVGFGRGVASFFQNLRIDPAWEVSSVNPALLLIGAF